MEYFAALGLALAIWAPALVGRHSLTTWLGSPLEYVLGPIGAGVVAALAIAAASALGVAIVLLALQAVQAPQRSAAELVRFAFSRSGNGLHAALAICSPLVLLVRILALGLDSPLLGELCVLSVLLSLAGLQCLRPTSYSGELWPRLRSLPRRVGQLWRTRPTQPSPAAPPSNPRIGAVSAARPTARTLAGHLQVQPPEQP